MVKISVTAQWDVPLYRQIIYQIEMLVSNYQLKPGDRVPTVRALAQTLGVNPATVARAYRELEGDGVLGASPRRGTVVLEEAISSQRLSSRYNSLSNAINNLILDTLSHGYSPEELEAAFTAQLSRSLRQKSVLAISPDQTD